MFFFFFDKLMPNTEYPDCVYHYTSGDAILGILKNKELWASHILFQNDKKEAVHAYEILETVLKEKKNDFLQHGLNIEKLYEFIKVFKGQDTFTLSFSEKKDDLNQWRSYANTKPAYCIGFSPEDLRQIDINENIKHNKSSKIRTIFFKCIYDEETQKKMIENLLDYVLEKKVRNQKIPVTEDAIYGYILHDFLIMSVLFKHPAFAEEKEWRLFFSPVVHELINIRMGKTNFIPYIKVPLEYNYIKELVIGPCDDEEHILNSTKYVCSFFSEKMSRKYDWKIETSTVPYRQ